MADLVDTPSGSEGSPPPVSSSSFSGVTDESSHGASVPYAATVENPFVVPLPDKPRRLCRSRDLPGPVPITEKTKADKAREKCVESNKRVVAGEGLIQELYQLSLDTHIAAKRYKDDGSRIFKELKRSHKTAVKERDIAQRAKNKLEAERDQLKLEKESKREIDKLKMKEAKRTESELAETRKKNSSLEKALADAHKKIEALSSE